MMMIVGGMLESRLTHLSQSGKTGGVQDSTAPGGV
jgi:hypothetical protein